MSGYFIYLVLIAMAAVVLFLGLGLYNMARGGDNETAQKMMRYRVLAQFAAVVLMLAALYFASR